MEKKEENRREKSLLLYISASAKFDSGLGGDFHSMKNLIEWAVLLAKGPNFHSTEI